MEEESASQGADEPSEDGPPQPRRRQPALRRLRAVWANPAYRFVIRFLPYLAIAALLYPRIAKQYNWLIQFVMVKTTALLFGIFSLFTDKVGSSQKMLAFDGFMVSIVDECTGIYEVIIFSAAVLAFPSRLRDKAVGLLLGNLIIYAFNILRITLLILIGRYSPEIFEFMHLYFWQATMILMIASVWLLWLFQVVRRGQSNISAVS